MDEATVEVRFCGFQFVDALTQGIFMVMIGGSKFQDEKEQHGQFGGSMVRPCWSV